MHHRAWLLSGFYHRALPIVPLWIQSCFISQQGFIDYREVRDPILCKKNHEPGCSSCLWSQHLGGRGRWISESVKSVWSTVSSEQPGLHRDPVSKNKQVSNKHDDKPVVWEYIMELSHQRCECQAQARRAHEDFKAQGQQHSCHVAQWHRACSAC